MLFRFFNEKTRPVLESHGVSRFTSIKVSKKFKTGVCTLANNDSRFLCRNNEQR